MKTPFRILASIAALTLAAGTWAQSRDEALFTAATAEQPAVVKTLEKLVNIETGTGNAEGLAAMADLLEAELKTLGFSVSRSKAVGKVVGDNLVGTVQGKGGKKLLLMAHMDTVYVKGTLAKAPFRVDGNRAFGPGIADDKGGIAVILHTLKLLKARGFQDFGSITVMFNTDEEIMLLTQDQEMIRDAVRDFAQTELWPHAARWDKEHHFPKEAHQGLAALGAYGICVPEEFGGANLDYVTLALVLEEIAAGDGGTSTAISVTNCPVNAILMRYGNAAAKARLAHARWRAARCWAPSA
jgi:hypothetical protein